MNFLNFINNDPFIKDLEKNTPVIIKTQQRTGRKYWTLIFGLSDELLSNKDLFKNLRQTFNCAVSKKISKQKEKYILMQGSHKRDLAEFFQQVYNINASY